MLPRRRDEDRPGSLRHAIGGELQAAWAAVRQSLTSPLRVAVLGAVIFILDAYSVDSGVRWPQPLDMGNPAWWLRLIPPLQVILPVSAVVVVVLRVAKPLGRIVRLTGQALDTRRGTATTVACALTLLSMFETVAFAFAGTGIEAVDRPLWHRAIAAWWLAVGIALAVAAWRVRVGMRSTQPRRSPPRRPSVAN